MAVNIIETKDCCPFNLTENKEKVLRSFSETFMADGNSVFHFISNTKNKEDDMPFAQLLRIWDEENKKWEWKWCAGRWVGDIKVSDTPKNTCQIKVVPRFGYLSLFTMLEEIFSINIINSFSQEDFKNNTNNLLQQLLPFIWAQRLGEANKYGVPHNTVDVLHKGPSVKGRLLVRKSILPFFKEQNVISATREKQVDGTICRIILQAYRLLNKPIVIDKKKKLTRNLFTRISDNAQNAIINFENAKIPQAQVTQKDYESIQYKSIYESWRSVVDMSWQIIQHHHFSQKESESKKGFGMFVDMAEIWELFLRSKLRKAFPDWDVSSPEIDTYQGTFFKRKIIPDIVMQRGNDVMIFDAKWKRMELKQYDVDRADFFQIHTYIQHYHRKGFNVVAGGLLYPISMEEEKLIAKNNRTSALHGIDRNTTFIVDGICFGDEMKITDIEMSKNEDAWKKQNEKFVESTEMFLGRLKSLIH